MKRGEKICCLVFTNHSLVLLLSLKNSFLISPIKYLKTNYWELRDSFIWNVVFIHTYNSGRILIVFNSYFDFYSNGYFVTPERFIWQGNCWNYNHTYKGLRKYLLCLAQLESSTNKFFTTYSSLAYKSPVQTFFFFYSKTFLLTSLHTSQYPLSFP